MGQKESRVNGFVFLLVSCINAVRRFSNAPQLGLISCRVTDVVNLLINSTNPLWLHVAF